MEDTLLTTSCVARTMTGRGHPKSEGWVRYAALTGKLPYIKTSNGQRLFKKSDVEDFVQKLNQKEPPSAV